MGLKFQRTDNLDDLFANFAVDPEKKVQSNEETNKFLKPAAEKDEKKKQDD